MLSKIGKNSGQSIMSYRPISSCVCNSDENVEIIIETLDNNLIKLKVFINSRAEEVC